MSAGIIGFIIGIFIGAPIGMILTALLIANNSKEDEP